MAELRVPITISNALLTPLWPNLLAVRHSLLTFATAYTDGRQPSRPTLFLILFSMNIENNDAKRAWQIVCHTNVNLFLTGKAGTGKTTFLRRLKDEAPKRMVVLAPTGIAAINAGGSTIHSFFQLAFGPYIPGTHYSKESFKLTKRKINMIRSLDLIVIDEVSMVRADLLDHVDAVLRRCRASGEPFGGVQMLLIGDLQQLSPVAKDEEWALLSKYYDSPYFFSSNALKRTYYATIELTHIYRQTDPAFIDLLNRVRNGQADAHTLTQLNSRYIPNFTPDPKDGYIRLVTHNYQARTINEQQMALLPHPTVTYKATISKDFPESTYPTDETLRLKKGAQVMFVKNDTDHRYYNGMMGDVVDLDDDSVTVRPHQGGDDIVVTPDEWTNSKYELNETTREITETIAGTFRQIPLRTAWSITIHKSQGLTFAHAIIDAASAFAHGQTYVALSRCTTLEGMVLSSPVPRDAIICDNTVTDYTERCAADSPTTESIRAMERNYFLLTCQQLFAFAEIRQLLEALSRQVEEHLYRALPIAAASLREELARFRTEVDEVAGRFAAQLARLTNQTEQYAEDATLQDRIHSACLYFKPKMLTLHAYVAGLSLPTDNVAVSKHIDSITTDLKTAIQAKAHLLAYVAGKGYHLASFLAERGRIAAGIPKEDTKGGKGKGKGKAPSATTESAATETAAHETAADGRGKTLLNALLKWRQAKAEALGIVPYMVVTRKALTNIVRERPTTPKALLAVAYVGPKTVEAYGKDILAIVQRATEA